jgi:hypothetical protein
MTDGGSATITQDDLDALNQRVLLRTAWLVRRLAEVVLLVALLVAIAWAWQVVRYQQLLTDNRVDGFLGVEVGAVGFTDIPWTERVDVFAGSLGLLGSAALTAGIGLTIRLYAEAATLRAGGRITAWELGDAIEPADDET